MSIRKDKAKEEMDLIIPKLESLCKKRNELYLDAKFGEIPPILDELDNTIGRYKFLAREYCYEDIIERGNNDPKQMFLELVKTMSYVVKRIKEDKSGDLKIPMLEVDETEILIDPYDFQKYDGLGKGVIGVDREWVFILERLNMMLTVMEAQKLKMEKASEVEALYKMKKASRGVDMGNVPVDDNELFEKFKKAVSATVGDEFEIRYTCDENGNVESPDLEFLKMAHTKVGKKNLVINAAKHKAFRTAFVSVLNNITTNTSKESSKYIVDYVKEK